MGAIGPVCRLAIKWHVRMFEQALHRLCGMAGPSGCPTLVPAAGCCAAHLASLSPSGPASQPAAPSSYSGPSGAEYSCCLARRENRQLEGIKNNSKKNLFSNQLNAEGGVRKRIKWSVASHMFAP